MYLYSCTDDRGLSNTTEYLINYSKFILFFINDNYHQEVENLKVARLWGCVLVRVISVLFVSCSSCLIKGKLVWTQWAVVCTVVAAAWLVCFITWSPQPPQERWAASLSSATGTSGASHRWNYQMRSILHFLQFYLCTFRPRISWDKCMI